MWNDKYPNYAERMHYMTIAAWWYYSHDNTLSLV